jgi:hypothetical protein
LICLNGCATLCQIKKQEVTLMNELNIKRRKKKFTRSPSYPSMDLGAAIEHAKTIKANEGDHFVSYRAILDDWGYKPKSSNGMLKLAALKKFGLIEDKGSGESREIKLTDLALKIIFYDENPENKENYYYALQEAALNPQIHKEIWNKWNGRLPSDTAMREYLLFNRPDGKFAETAVDDFIKQFRTTITIANLENSDIMSGHDNDKDKQFKEKKMERMPTQQTELPGSKSIVGSGITQTREIPIYLPSGKTGLIQIPHLLTEQEWNQMLSILNVYKPSLVAQKENENIDGEKEQ